eukprot:scaffold13513_cov130-Isochrysis_galbana.AAC.6
MRRTHDARGSGTGTSRNRANRATSLMAWVRFSFLPFGDSKSTSRPMPCEPSFLSIPTLDLVHMMKPSSAAGSPSNNSFISRSWITRDAARRLMGQGQGLFGCSLQIYFTAVCPTG